MRAKKMLCLLLALGVVGRAEAGTVLVFDGSGNITSSYVDSTTPYSYGKIQTETSGLLYKKLLSMGFEPSSTQATATIEAVESVATGAVSGARAGFGGGWIGTVAGAVVGSVVSSAIALGVDKLWSWLFGSSSSNAVTVTQSTPSSGSGSYWNGPVWIDSGSTQTTQTECSTDLPTLVQAMQDGLNNVYNKEIAVGQGWSNYVLTPGTPSNGSVAIDMKRTYTSTGTVNDNPGWTNLSTYPDTSICAVTLAAPPTTTTGSGPVTVGDAIAQLPSSELSQPVNPELVADTTNALWQQASQQPGYKGVAYDPSNPISTQDATDWQNANPSYTPTVGDGLGSGSGAGTQGTTGSGGSLGALPVSNQPGSSDPTTGVNTGTGTGTGTNPASGTSASGANCGAAGESPCEVDWGSNPGTAQPSLESTPTIAMILGPILNMLPGFTSFQVPAHASACPTATFSMFGQTYTMDQHCTIFEQNRTAISGAFAVVFLLASVFIVLTA